MATLFVLEAPGLAPSILMTPEGRFLAAFEARGEMMGWSSTSRSRSRRNLWDLYEAGLTGLVNAPAITGWVYGGFPDPQNTEAFPVPEVMAEEGRPVGPVAMSKPGGGGAAPGELSAALPPLVQCFDDALRRIGAVDVPGVQLTCYEANGQLPVGQGSHLATAGWFNAAREIEVEALITFDREFLGGRSPDDLAVRLQRMQTRAITFGESTNAPEQYRVNAPVCTPLPEIHLEPSHVGLTVSLPEWTASAVGWTLATVVDGAYALGLGGVNFSVRVTRFE